MSIIGQSGQQAEGTKQVASEVVGHHHQRHHPWSQLLDRQRVRTESRRGGRFRRHQTIGATGAIQTRSPHNAHMTMLARAGVPGLVLWVLVLVSWFGMLMRAILTARARGHKQWADLFLFIGCYAAAIVINATFDVVLEGPVQGIWFWCLFGFGVGSVMIYRAQPFTISPGGVR